jgi:hypothetical protein
MKKEININPEDERPAEPFDTVVDLVFEHGNRKLLGCLTWSVGFDARYTDFTPEYRKGAAYLHLKLTQLLARYDRLYPDLEEEEKFFYPALAEIEDTPDTPEPMTLPSAAKAKSAEPQQAIARAMQIASPVEMSDAAVLGL